MVATPQALADALGKGLRTVARWRTDPGIPGGNAGPWDPAKVAEWARRKVSKNQRRGLPPADDHGVEPASDTDDVATLASADSRSAEFRAVQISYRKVKLASALLQLERDKGELVQAAKVRMLLRSRASEIRTAFRTFGRRHAPKLLACKTLRAMDQLWIRLMDEALRTFIRDQGFEDLLQDD